MASELKKTDILYIGNPEDYIFIADLVPANLIVVYDCMDDLCEFPGNKTEPAISRIIKEEGQLIARADHIIASSLHLKNILQIRYPVQKQLHVINNAVDESFIAGTMKPSSISDYPEKVQFTDLLYIGTISEWFDFTLLLMALEKFRDLRLILIGPKCTAIPYHDRIIHLGSKTHSSLPAYMSRADALIMPFILNDLIAAVNPVKLYEYIASGKPCIANDYAESRNFGNFVFLYSDNVDFYRLLQALVDRKLLVSPEPERNKFLSENTWAHRASEIFRIVEKEN